MEGFAYSDIDRLILLNSNAESFLKLCSLNKHFQTLCEKDNYNLYRIKLERDYPDTLLNVNYNTVNWKYLYLQTVKKVALLKEKYNYTYISGNLDVITNIFSALARTDPFQYYNYMLTLSIINSEITLIKYALKMKSNAILTPGVIKRAEITGNKDIITLLKQKGAV